MGGNSKWLRQGWMNVDVGGGGSKVRPPHPWRQCPSLVHLLCTKPHPTPHAGRGVSRNYAPPTPNNRPPLVTGPPMGPRLWRKTPGQQRKCPGHLTQLHRSQHSTQVHTRDWRRTKRRGCTTIPSPRAELAPSLCMSRMTGAPPQHWQQPYGNRIHLPIKHHGPAAVGKVACGRTRNPPSGWC